MFAMFTEILEIAPLSTIHLCSQTINKGTLNHENIRGLRIMNNVLFFTKEP